MDQSFSPISNSSGGSFNDTGVAVLNPPAAPETSTSDLMASVNAALSNPPSGLAAAAAIVPEIERTDVGVKVAAEPAGPLDLLPETGDATTNKTKIIIKALRGMEESIRNIIRLLEDQGATAGVANMAAEADHGFRELAQAAAATVDGRVVEGVFDGKQMIGSDGNPYSVPPNYASKSKLVEGDMLKLTITPKGSFIYKQIGPIERSRIMATLGFDQTNNEWYATDEEKRWSILKASVTFFRGEPGDDVAILVPNSAPSKWAAVENIIKKNPLA